ALEPSVEFGTRLGSSCLQAGFPFHTRGRTALAGLAPGLQDFIGNDEGRVLPSQFDARGGDFLSAERRAVGARGSLLVGRAIANDRAAGDERRLLGMLGCVERLGNGLGIMAIDTNDSPAVGGEAFQLVCRIGEAEL